MDHIEKFDPLIDKLAFLLAQKYRSQGDELLEEMVVNASFILDFDHHDNWNGGIDLYNLYLYLPAKYITMIDRENVKTTLLSDIKELSTPSYPVIVDVHIDMLDSEVHSKWREHSGLLENTDPVAKQIDYSVLDDVWESGYFRLFISHKTSKEELAQNLSKQLRVYGVSSFVATDKIKPTEEWARKLEAAMFSAEALVGLISDDFINSEWTDQEMGIAYGRNIPIITVNLERDPYGFMAKYQAIVYEKVRKVDMLAKKVFEVLKNKHTLKDRMQEALAASFLHSISYEESKAKMELLLEFERITEKALRLVEQAYAENSQVKKCFFVRDNLPTLKRRIAK